MEWYWWFFIAVIIVSIPFKIKFMKWYSKRQKENSSKNGDDK